MSTNLERTREAQRFLAQYFEPTRLLATDFGTVRTYLKLEAEKRIKALAADESGHRNDAD